MHQNRSRFRQGAPPPGPSWESGETTPDLVDCGAPPHSPPLNAFDVWSGVLKMITWQPHTQGRRQVKICGVDRHGERGRRTDHPPPILPPIKIAGFVSISGATSSKSGVEHVHPSPPRGDATAYTQKLIGLMDVFSTQQRLCRAVKYHMKQSTPKL